VNKGNNISYTEFLAAVMEMQGRIEEYRLAEAFDQIDVDGSGYSKYRFFRKSISLHFQLKMDRLFPSLKFPKTIYGC
jgi:Ca2+-binding EF-hand superfamily protein